VLGSFVDAIGRGAGRPGPLLEPTGGSDDHDEPDTPRPAY
jgi:hypothetical protein